MVLLRSRAKDARKELLRRQAHLSILNTKMDQCRDSLLAKKRQHEAFLKARLLIQEAAQMTQQKIEFHISNLVTTALAAIWDDHYEFCLEFVKRRGATEADLWFVRNQKKIEPLESSGGGAKDIAALALRVGYWSLTKATRPILIIDEPFRNLSEGLQLKAANMLQTLSKQLGLQIICASHIEALQQGADRRFEVQLINGISEISTKRAENT